IRTERADDDPHDVSEFPHIIVNQARVLDYFAEFAENGPARITPDYGYEFLNLEHSEHDDYPVTVTVRRTDEQEEGKTQTIRTQYVVGCDGAHSKVRASIGQTLVGDQSLQAWGVIDILAVTDFPDIRIKSAIQSHDQGSILLIP